MEKIKVLDLFSGIGGFSLAFVMEGFHIAAAIDSDRKACEIYRQNLKNRKVICEDIGNINIKLLPDFDILIGYIFARSFSAVGRNEINQYVYRIIDLKMPKVFVFEVTNKSRLEEALDVLSKKRYRTQYIFADSEVITGKPLIEKRIYLIGIRTDLADVEFFLKESDRHVPFRDIMQKGNISFEKYLLKESKKVINPLNLDTGRITCNCIDIPYVETSYGLRRITTREFARLKGYPDKYLLNDKNIWQTYRMVLNSTNVTVARLIAQNLNNYFAEEKSGE